MMWNELLTLTNGLSLLASVGTILSMWLLSGRHRSGWYVSLGNQVVWAAFMVSTEAWGLIPLNLIMVGLAIRGVKKWK